MKPVLSTVIGSVQLDRSAPHARICGVRPASHSKLPWAISVAVVGALLAGAYVFTRDDRDPGDQTAVTSAGNERPRENAAATKRELLSRVSAAIRSRGNEGTGLDLLAYTDLAAARRQLGLPEDAGFPEPGKRRLLFALASRPLFSFRTLFGRNPDLGALGEVLEAEYIEAAASTNEAFSGPGADQVYRDDVIVVATRQPFEEIASKLRSDGGYEEVRDGLLVGGGRPNGRVASAEDDLRRLPFQAVGDAQGGVVVLAGLLPAARAAQAGAGTKLTPAAKLLAQLPGVAGVARGRFGAPCVSAIGLGEDAAPHAGELVVIVDGTAQADRFLFSGRTYEGGPGYPALDGEVAFSDATTNGNRARVHFRSTDRRNVTRIPAEEVEFPYDCE